tara:strand:- start:199 stop:345 length:147 start_codon:yes stop_codon:yes gene_type:complete
MTSNDKYYACMAALFIIFMLGLTTLAIVEKTYDSKCKCDTPIILEKHE